MNESLKCIICGSTKEYAGYCIYHDQNWFCAQHLDLRLTDTQLNAIRIASREGKNAHHYIEDDTNLGLYDIFEFLKAKNKEFILLPIGL